MLTANLARDGHIPHAINAKLHILLFQEGIVAIGILIFHRLLISWINDIIGRLVLYGTEDGPYSTV